MAAPATLTEQLDTLYSTTWQSMRDKAVDQIYNARPFWWWMNTNGRRSPQSGGRFIGIQLNYAKNDTVKSIGRFGTVPINPQDPLTTAIYNWRYVAGSVQRGWIDDQQNSGEYEIIDRVQVDLDNLILSLQDELARQLFAPTPGALDIEGLPVHVSATPATGSVGGLDANALTWWRNQQMAASGPMADALLADMRKLTRLVAEGVDYPDLLLTTPEVFEAYEATVAEFYQLTNRKASDAGFENFSFKGITLFWDGTVPAGQMYALNSRYLTVKYDPRVEFAMTEWKQIPNQLDRVAQIVWAGNLCSSQRRRQGVLTGLA